MSVFTHSTFIHSVLPTQMTKFSVIILGSNSAMPVYDRHPSAQVLNVNENLYLIDCGEGTQMQIQKYSIRTAKLNHIFISHLHGDHYLGLIPLLDTFALLGRTVPIYLYAPAALLKVIDLHRTINGWTMEDAPYPIHFYPLNPSESELILDSKNLKVRSIPLDHRVPCTGFVFEEKQKDRKMLAEKIKTFNIPYTAIPSIKKGADFTTEEGVVIPNTELTADPPQTRSYAYCSDTAYTESILPFIEGVDLLYHEATYLEDRAELAAPRGHSTAKEAATIARKAGAKQLLLGHFSSRYQELYPFEEEAKTVFLNSELAVEGKEFVVE
ncbi:MAG: ribonuclease Z [Flavobacteriales bacterium]